MNIPDLKEVLVQERKRSLREQVLEGIGETIKKEKEVGKLSDLFVDLIESYESRERRPSRAQEKRSYQYDQKLKKIRKSVTACLGNDEGEYDIITTTPPGSAPWFLWIWLENKKSDRFKGVSVGIYIVSEYVREKKNCTPGVYLVLQYGTKAISDVFGRKSVRVSSITPDIERKAEMLKRQAVTDLREANVLESPLISFENSLVNTILSHWKNAFVEQDRYLEPAQYAYGIICLKQYNVPEWALKNTDEVFCEDLRKYISAVSILEHNNAQGKK